MSGPLGLSTQQIASLTVADIVAWTTSDIQD